MYKINELFDLQHTIAKDYLSKFEYPHEALKGIGELIEALGPALGSDYVQVAESVWVHKSATIAPTAFLGKRCIIGPETEVRHCAFIRGNAIVGASCVVGNSCELKNAILFDNVQVPHFNYVGDSILGYKSHMGAGSITSNVRSDKALVVIHDCIESYETGIKKVGAMVGDFTEIGCNSVLNPGTQIGRSCIVYPLSCVRGVVKECSIWKNNGSVVARRV